MEAGERSGFGGTWYSGSTPLPAPRAALNYDLDVDVCVVGGGFAGLTAAHELVRRRLSVALLEAGRIAGGASGRASGFVVPGYPSRIEKIVERVGLPAAKALWVLSEAGVEYVRETAAALGESGILGGNGWLDVSKTTGAGAARGRVNLLGQEFGIETEFWPREQVRAVLKTSRYFHAIHFPRAFHINPLAYALALAESVEKAGAHVFENTPVTAIDPAGVRKRVTTPRGRVRAGRIVLAGNIMRAAGTERLSDSLLPITAYTGVTKPLGENLGAAIAYPGAVSDSHCGSHHYRIVGGDRLLWTGGATVMPRRAGRAKQTLERAIRATFPRLGPVAFESFWAGEMGFAIHAMPQIGEVQPGVWLAAAFGSHGIGNAAVAGQMIARAIVEGDDTWRIFQPYELVWAGGRFGRVVAEATIQWCRGQEAITALAARRREERQQRRLAEAARRAEEAARRAEEANRRAEEAARRAEEAAKLSEAARAPPAYRIIEIIHPEPTQAPTPPSGQGTVPEPSASGQPAAGSPPAETVLQLPPEARPVAVTEPLVLDAGKEADAAVVNALSSASAATDRPGETTPSAPAAEESPVN